MASSALRSSAFRRAFAAPRPVVSSPSAITARVAGFHASPTRAILPPLPQKISGTVNDPVVVPHSSYAHGSYHWTMERALSIGLIPLTIAPFAAGSLSPVVDGLLVGSILVHSHIGFQSAIIDYFPVWRVPMVRKGLMWLLNLCTVLVGIGFYEFETNDVGLTEAIKRIWSARA
ncbi:succinate dehydrogenase subunit D [Myriangium duriaei CBS 260.36]|uniref:Succinate dehydrogenase [ubiquinone] cytochrome b small subunit n=1 Tax=Myriangium duriaei CBS 260.36 TaxID=1168546 RepID=A0A9P4ITZ0_9PEZI|nr:succinate dehydrogenase subunit D [Myriangium duriaei CBS 260.36]